ncbi:D-beta-hydroxybutyrate dehydrogenase, mitochondrial-like [Indicator indicator]|uniref:D-beta-hydroxybutyrate dehydrogenase, mitochondrial-like n=1 Tax=Indicator indicator TaxID=1002788 RepID=UPI0023DEC824|nr:D-beta-hydroxybutyrate dehydrogenase, mitochondrial-like [Indicator indicator]
MWAAVSLLLLLLLLARLWRRGALPLEPAGRAVLITGCDSGFGHLLALRLHRLGFTVFAGCLCPSGEGARRLQREAAVGPGHLRVLRLDVTRDRDVLAAKEMVLSHLPEQGFWGLVNNAGISTFGETGWLSMEKYEKFADVNLLGSIRTTLAFLPLLRKYKGRIVFMSSVIAYFTLGNGIYSMTKAAIEKFCDALRLEMKKFGVQVCIIQPGNYARSTQIQPPVSAEEIWNELSEEEKAVYNKEYVQERANFFNSILSEGSPNSSEVVDAMVDALMSPAPKARYMVAKLKEKALVFVCTLFPTVVMDSVLSYALSKVKLGPHCTEPCSRSLPPCRGSSLPSARKPATRLRTLPHPPFRGRKGALPYLAPLTVLKAAAAEGNGWEQRLKAAAEGSG